MGDITEEENDIMKYFASKYFIENKWKWERGTPKTPTNCVVCDDTDCEPTLTMSCGHSMHELCLIKGIVMYDWRECIMLDCKKKFES